MSNAINNLMEFGRFRLDTEKKVLWFADNPVNLTLKEIELLCVLTESSGEVVTKEELMNKVWADSFVEESNLSRHIYCLRKKFKELGEAEGLIQTIPRRGYRFAGEIHEQDNGEFIIERHSISRTLIEELEDSIEPNLKVVPTKAADKKRIFAPLILLTIIITTAFAYYYNRNLVSNSQPIRSIAVLPLKSLGIDKNDEALRLGFADTLITRLSQIDELKVISVNAISRYTGVTQEPLEIGKKLNVDVVIDGTLQKANGKLRVTLRMIRISDNKQLWSDSFDEAELEIFRLQDLIARETAQALSLKLNPKDSFKKLTENQDAYQFYLQGQYFFRRRETSKGGTFFKKAVETDPTFAKAWAGLAAAYAMGDAMDEAEATVNKALELEPDLAEAHAVRGFIKMFLNWDWIEAEKSLNRALELDPNSVEAHHWQGIYLAIRGRFEEAKAELNMALELDPTSANMFSDLGQIYYFSREYEKAEQLYRKAELMELHITGERLYRLYNKQGLEPEAYQSRFNFHCSHYDNAAKLECEGSYKKLFEKAGTKETARQRLNDTLNQLANNKIPANSIADTWYSLAIIYLQLGEKRKAIQSLNRVLETRNRFEITNFTFPFIAVDPTFDELKDNPSFQEILQKINLIPSEQ